ncbi:putative nucleotidyltransferase [Rubrobacter radiotolerans]|uniref:Nucleotidyltransferase family protein n=1 Tax=Rubrobacter radiotolerans TaxID=42256 RepID=A0A023X584_RUBRA|nr:nucleotidyltransferase family protein [Rubrobacter radiotolerans]AHY47381.1 putative nucleotidyltransferase [Rubrobacter radiotolerans]MDX5894785.1 nucleotidyltransferase family protein [Rubrobacter radiotolerans]SMC06763.1 hypothetical protein SAMN00767673_2101 [Rubrobacter radiotolerans DSM 5868]
MNETVHTRLRENEDELRKLCERYGVARLAVFGSALGEGFTDGSDLDLLVAFLPGRTPGLAFVRLQRELSELLGLDVDLHTERSLSRYFRDEALRKSRAVFASKDAEDTVRVG